MLGLLYRQLQSEERLGTNEREVNNKDSDAVLLLVVLILTHPFHRFLVLKEGLPVEEARHFHVHNSFPVAEHGTSFLTINLTKPYSSQ